MHTNRLHARHCRIAKTWLHVIIQATPDFPFELMSWKHAETKFQAQQMSWARTSTANECVHWLWNWIGLYSRLGDERDCYLIALVLLLFRFIGMYARICLQLAIVVGISTNLWTPRTVTNPQFCGLFKNESSFKDDNVSIKWQQYANKKNMENSEKCDGERCSDWQRNKDQMEHWNEKISLAPDECVL